MNNFNNEFNKRKNKWEHLQKYCEDTVETSDFEINFANIINKPQKYTCKKSFKTHLKIKEQLVKECRYFLGTLNDFKNGFLKFIKTLAKVLIIPIALGVIGISFNNKTSSNSTTALASTDILKPVKGFKYNNMSLACSRSRQECAAELNERVLSIQTNKGSGTGFVVEGNESYLTVLTASHVIRTGNGHNSVINDGLYIYGKENVGVEEPLIACAFFKNGYADVGLIKIKNTTGIIFDKMENFSSARAFEKVMVIDNKYPEKKRSWVYTINSFFTDRNLLVLNDVAQPGMSGSPIVKMDGALLGILISGNDYYTNGTYKFDDIISFGIDYLNSQQNYFAPYICKQY